MPDHGRGGEQIELGERPGHGPDPRFLCPSRVSEPDNPICDGASRMPPRLSASASAARRPARMRCSGSGRGAVTYRHRPGEVGAPRVAGAPVVWVKVRIHPPVVVDEELRLPILRRSRLLLLHEELHRLTERVVRVEPQVLAEVDIRNALVAVDHEHVLVVRVSARLAEVRAAAHYRRVLCAWLTSSATAG